MKISNKFKLFIIAEAGINHNGDLNIAKELAYQAYNVGADAIKYQTSWNITRLSDYSFTKDEWYELKYYCDDIGIEFMSTPHTFEAIHFLELLVNKYKIASTYLGLPNFLVEVAKKNKPIFLSVGNIIHDNGIATDEEIRNALSFVPHADITLLHCVSKYPCNESYYERINELKKFGKPVGLSDHSKNIQIPTNVSVIERHFMLDNQKCIDSNVSLTSSEFKQMVEWIKNEA
jgi:N,N'-diacetyllegionaminate synthase